MLLNFKKLFIFVSCLILSVSAYSQNVSRTDSLTTEELFYNLDEVMVTGERPIAKMERGGLVYDMPLLLKQLPADNAYDALTRIPAVTEMNGQLLLAGRPVTLIINGKATTLSAEQVTERLKQMPSERLKNVDVMLSAPAYYHVRGQVINIVTKDNFGQNQLSGQIQGTGVFSKRSYGHGAGTLLFSNNHFSLDAMYSFSGGMQYGLTRHDAIHPLAIGPVEYHDQNEGYNRFIQHNYSLGLEYAFAQNHRIDLSYTGKWSSSRNNNIATGDTKSDMKSTSHNYLHNIDLGYCTPFGLDLRASYTNYELPREQILEGEIYGERKDYRVESGQKIHKWDLTADQSHSFKDTWGVNYGVRMQITRHNSWQNTYLPSGEPVEGGTSSIGYTERISSFYASLSNSWKTVSAELGVQAENYYTPDWKKWRIYPTLNVMWKANDNNSLNFSFSSNATYPSYWTLMNSVFHSSTYTEVWGNPELKPQSDYDITATWRFYTKYTLTAFCSIQDNWMTQLPYQTSDRMAVLMQYVNFNYRHNAGLSASAQWKIGKWANGNATAALFYVHDRNDHFHEIPFNREKISGMLSASAVITPFPAQRLTLMLQPAYQFATIQGVYDIHPFFRLHATLRWMSKNERFIASFSANNITNMYYNITDTWQGQNLSMKTYQNWRNFSLSLVYKFGNKKEKQRKQVDTSRMGH